MIVPLGSLGRSSVVSMPEITLRSSLIPSRGRDRRKIGRMIAEARTMGMDNGYLNALRAFSSGCMSILMLAF